MKSARSITPSSLDLDAVSGVYPSGAYLDDLLDIANEIGGADCVLEFPAKLEPSVSFRRIDGQWRVCVREGMPDDELATALEWGIEQLRDMVTT
jgi:hypothetical protein